MERLPKPGRPWKTDPLPPVGELVRQRCPTKSEREKLAKELGISPAILYKLMSGEIRLKRHDAIDGILSKLGVLLEVDPEGWAQAVSQTFPQRFSKRGVHDSNRRDFLIEFMMVLSTVGLGPAIHTLESAAPRPRPSEPFDDEGVKPQRTSQQAGNRPVGESGQSAQALLDEAELDTVPPVLENDGGRAVRATRGLLQVSYRGYVLLSEESSHFTHDEATQRVLAKLGLLLGWSYTEEREPPGIVLEEYLPRAWERADRIGDRELSSCVRWVAGVLWRRRFDRSNQPGAAEQARRLLEGALKFADHPWLEGYAGFAHKVDSAQIVGGLPKKSSCGLDTPLSRRSSRLPNHG